MEDPEKTIPLIVIITVLFFALLFLYHILNFLAPGLIKKKMGRHMLLRGLKRAYKPYLAHNFPFYNKLSDKDKIVFERRVQRFIDMKEFIPRGGIREITYEMKALIAGSAVQLTFGYPSIYFRHFYRILIYPNNYYSNITQQYHKGEVNLGGLIVISWKSLKDGFTDPSDGHHLGLHEMAHALRLINLIDNDEYNFFDREIMQEFDREAEKEIAKIKDNQYQTSLFRNYGATNKSEFFAVAVEVFFEQAAQFKNYNYQLYTLLTKILKIDPTAICVSSEINNLQTRKYA